MLDHCLIISNGWCKVSKALALGIPTPNRVNTNSVSHGISRFLSDVEVKGSEKIEISLQQDRAVRKVDDDTILGCHPFDFNIRIQSRCRCDRDGVSVQKSENRIHTIDFDLHMV